MTTNEAGVLLKLSECAERLGKTQQTIRNFVIAGHIKHVRSGKLWFVPESEVLRIESHGLLITRLAIRPRVRRTPLAQEPAATAARSSSGPASQTQFVHA